MLLRVSVWEKSAKAPPIKGVLATVEPVSASTMLVVLIEKGVPNVNSNALPFFASYNPPV
jgi:hypothetical protein